MSTETRLSKGTSFRAFVAAACLLGAGGTWSQTAGCLTATTPVSSIEMRVLLISADGNESVLPAIRNTLDYVGIPYDLMLAKNAALTSGVLCSTVGGQGVGKYQAVLLANGNLPFEESPNNWVSGFSWDEWNLLWQYEAKYKVRQAALYTYPGGWPDNFGLNLPSAGFDTSNAPLSTSLTSTSPAGSGNPSGRQVFSYLNPATPVVIRNSWTYLAKPSGGSVTPLLVDGAGNSIVSINNYADGRKSLAVTTDGNPYLMHTLALGYGIVNWVTKGLYVGEWRVYLSAQPDDVLIPDDMWDPVTSRDDTGKTYRMTKDDYNKFVTWQSNRNNNNPGTIVMDMAFNAFGSTSGLDPEELFPATKDDLTPAILKNNAPFTWVSHTYTHPQLDNASYGAMLNELRQNDNAAIGSKLKLIQYQKDALVTPEVSGLNNAEALRAMSDFGVRYIVSDTSKFCGNRDAAPRPCPRPNAGVYNDLQPNILMVPRYPANLFYNVCTPQEWTSEYNFLYRSFWGKNLSYAEILGKESDVWLSYMLNGDMRPVMFHQPNMCAYNGGNRSLLGDLIDATIAKYSAIYTLPPRSRQLRQIGKLMADGMALRTAFAPAGGQPLSAKIVPGATSSSIVLTNPTSVAVTVPVTGVDWSAASSRETYGGQTTSRINLNANGGAVTVSGAPAWQ